MTVRWIIPFLLATVVLAACASAGVPTQPAQRNPTSELAPIPTQTLIPTETIVPDQMPAQSMPAPRNSYLPKPGDEQLTSGQVDISEAGLLAGAGDPPHMVLILKGTLPTPCDELRVTIEADDQNRINVEVYSLSSPKKICIQILSPFDANIPLGIYPSGHYSVWVNGVKIGDFDS